MNEEEKKVEEAAAEPVKSRKDTFNERFGKRFPDVDAADEEAYYGALNDEFDRVEKNDNAQRELGEVLAGDPRSAGFLMALKNGENPMTYMIEMYGEDFKAALEDEAKAKELADAFAKYADKQAESERLRAESEKNMQGMMDALDEAQKDGSFSDDDAAKAFEYLYGDGGLLDRILVSDVRKEDWMMLMKAENYDRMKAEGEEAAKTAHEEGVVEGRNANIDIQKKKQTQAKKMPGNVPSAGSARPAAKKNDYLDFLDSRNKSVWKD